VSVGLLAAMLLLMLAGAVWAGERGGPAASGVLAAPTKGVLPGRQAATSTPTPDGWRITGGIEMRRRDDGTWRIDLDFWLRAETGSTAAPAATDTPTTVAPSTSTPTMTPSGTPLPTNTPRPTNTPTWTPSPSSTPIATAPQEPTATQEHACVVRSTANVNARTLPMVRSDTAIGVLPADSPVRITGYYLEHTGDDTYTWYRYWYDVDHPEAWSRADFFTERDDTPGCQLLPRVTEP
jgi:hypothetical protein